MVDEKSDVGVRLEATFTDFNDNSGCKTNKRTLFIFLVNERASGWLLVTCFLHRWNYDNGQIYDSNQTFLCKPRFPKSGWPPLTNFARPSMKLCCFALWYGQSRRGRVIEGLLNSSTFVSTIIEFFTKEPTRNYIGYLIVVQDNALCHVLKKVSIFLLISCTASSALIAISHTLSIVFTKFR